MARRVRNARWFVVGLFCVFLGSRNAAAQNAGLQCEVKGRDVHISWEGILDPGQAFPSVLERDGEWIAQPASGDVSFTDVNVPPGLHVYTLTLVSANGIGEQFSCTVFVAAEAGLLCTVEGPVVNLTWGVPDGTTALGFLIFRDNRVIDALGPDARSYRDAPGPGAHVYRVTTNNSLDPNVPPNPPDVLIGECQVAVDDGFGRLDCQVQGGIVTLNWEVSEDIPVFGFLVVRNNEIIAQLGPDARTLRDEPGPGRHTYAVSTNNRLAGAVAPDFPIGECTVFIPDSMGDVRCEVDGPVVIVSWEFDPNLATDGFRVVRDNEVIAEVGPDTRQIRDTPPPGRHVYTVATNGGLNAFDLVIGSCEVVVGEDMTGPQDLQCAIAESFPIQVQLFWSNPVPYAQILIARNGQQIAVLPGVATRFSEFDPGAGLYVYSVTGLSENGELTPSATCVVIIDGPPNVHHLDLVGGNVIGGNQDPNGPLAASDSLTAVLTPSDPVQAWSFGVCSDPALLRVASATTDGTAAGALNDGSGPSFLAINVMEGGVTMAAVISKSDPTIVIPAGARASLLRIGYEAGPEGATGTPYPVEFCRDLGDPPVDVLVVVGGLEVPPATTGGLVVLSDSRFLRADANDDGTVDMSDGIFVLNWLFRSGPRPNCMDASDANGSQDVNIADPVYTFQRLFASGPPPPPPYPACGGAVEVLGCEESLCNPDER